MSNLSDKLYSTWQLLGRSAPVLSFEILAKQNITVKIISVSFHSPTILMSNFSIDRRRFPRGRWKDEI